MNSQTAHRIAVDIVITRVNEHCRVFGLTKPAHSSQRKYEDRSCLK